ncbi:hypothetical protein MRX96_017690 [Rhipicephalus microplus]
MDHQPQVAKNKSKKRSASKSSRAELSATSSNADEPIRSTPEKTGISAGRPSDSEKARMSGEKRQSPKRTAPTTSQTQHRHSRTLSLQTNPASLKRHSGAKHETAGGQAAGANTSALGKAALSSLSTSTSTGGGNLLVGELAEARRPGRGGHGQAEQPTGASKRGSGSAGRRSRRVAAGRPSRRRCTARETGFSAKDGKGDTDDRIRSEAATTGSTTGRSRVAKGDKTKHTRRDEDGDHSGDATSDRWSSRPAARRLRHGLEESLHPSWWTRRRSPVFRRPYRPRVGTPRSTRKRTPPADFWAVPCAEPELPFASVEYMSPPAGAAVAKVAPVGGQRKADRKCLESTITAGGGRKSAAVTSEAGAAVTTEATIMMDVNPYVRYPLLTMNLLIWLMGLTLLLVGAYAYVDTWTQTDIPSSSTTYNIYSMFVIKMEITVMLFGMVTMSLSFCGCVGALRENTCLLNVYSSFITALLLLNLLAGLVVFFLPSQIKKLLSETFSMELIVHYRDSPDFQRLMDSIQERMQCCGISKRNFRDWNANMYFNCSRANPSSERCSVPYSCCKAQHYRTGSCILIYSLVPSSPHW